MIFIYTFGLLAVAILFLPNTRKLDPRLAGPLLLSKGGVVFFLGGLVLTLLAESTKLPTLRIFGNFICVVSYVVILCGFGLMSYKSFHGRDPKREVDPGYDLDYILCPHCQQAEMRKETSVVKCPVCKKKTRL